MNNGPMLTMTANQDDGDVTLTIKFHQTLKPDEVLEACSAMVTAAIETVVKTLDGTGVTREQIIDAMLEGDRGSEVVSSKMTRNPPAAESSSPSTPKGAERGE